MMLERDIEKRLIQKIKAIGGKAYKFVSPGHAGVPDRIVILPGGKVFFVELKTDIGKLTPLQDKQINCLRKLNANVVVLRGESAVDDFVKVCKELIL